MTLPLYCTVQHRIRVVDPYYGWVTGFPSDVVSMKGKTISGRGQYLEGNTFVLRTVYTASNSHVQSRVIWSQPGQGNAAEELKVRGVEREPG